MTLIFSYVIRKGYTGTWRALDARIFRIFKNNFGNVLRMNFYLDFAYPLDITVLSRSAVIRYITVKDKKKKDVNLDCHIDAVKETYPIVGKIEKIYSDFHSVLMGDDANRLDSFISDYRKSSLSSFIEGIEKDIAPVKNAISYSESSGFVEGNNNKFKLIKRILYGRSQLVSFFRKSYIPFLMNNIDFHLSDLL